MQIPWHYVGASTYITGRLETECDDQATAKELSTLGKKFKKDDIAVVRAAKSFVVQWDVIHNCTHSSSKTCILALVTLHITYTSTSTISTPFSPPFPAPAPAPVPQIQCCYLR
jgi:hypothetical protein